MNGQYAFCGNESWQLDRVYGLGRREKLENDLGHFLGPITLQNFDANRDKWEKVEVLFSTWGMDEALARRVSELPRLKAFFYAAGTVQSFARPLLEKNIWVVSAWAANAIPVAHFTYAQILLSLKGYFRDIREARKPANRGRRIEIPAPGIFQNTVALLGFGKIGAAVANPLQGLGLRVLAYAPFLTDDEAKSHGITRVTLSEAFSLGEVISNHLPDLAPTRGLLNRELFSLMRNGATFINTGRGATVVEPDLIQVLRERPDLTALLDVVFPEPPESHSPWYDLENAVISSHIAGSLGNEVVRMADLMIEEFWAWKKGKPLKYAVTLPMLETMA